jgi:nucleoside-diphosphate-sugar epimerase
MEILITGATGFLSRHLIPALQERGATLRALALPTEDTSWLEERGVTIYRGDICEPETLVAPLRGAQIVFHLAGMMGLWRPIRDYYKVNVTGAENVCRLALQAGVRRIIHISSWTVYGMGLGYPVREHAPLQPFQEPYAVTKAAGDRAVQGLIAREHLPAVIVRPGTFFGPGDYLHFGRMSDRLRNGKGLIVGSGRNALPFVYVTDVVQGLLLAAENERAVGQAYNITNDTPLTQEEILRAIAEEIGAQAPRRHVPYAAIYAAAAAIEEAAVMTHRQQQPIVTRLGVKLFGGDNRHSIDKAREELGFTPQISLREGIRLAARWYLEQLRSQERTNTAQLAQAPVAKTG